MFKQCTNCSTKWLEPDHFLSDPLVEYVGYQAAFGTSPLDGLFLFNHVDTACCTTLSVGVSKLQPTLDGAEKVGMKESKACLGLCAIFDNTEECPGKDCIGNQVRDLMIQVKEYPKRAPLS